MRWIQPTLFRTRFVRAKQVQWEEWVTDADQPCARCKALDGKRYVKGRGPQPITDTHPGCRCQRVAISGRFAASPVQRSQSQSVPSSVTDRGVLNPFGLGSLRQAGFVLRHRRPMNDIVRSCKGPIGSPE